MDFKVLVVEDEPLQQEIIEFALSKSGHEVLQATTLTEAWELFLFNKDIGVILVDGHVPVGESERLHLEATKTTVDFVRGIRQCFPRSLKHIVAISGERERQEQLMKAGCDVSLPKPFHVDQLIKLVGQA